MLPSEIKSIVDFLEQNSSDDAMFKALLLLLENASDSTVIIEALEMVQPHEKFSEDNKDKAVELLKNAEAEDLAKKWEPMAVAAEPENHSSNVVSLLSKEDASNSYNKNIEAPPSLQGKKVIFDDIGGLENVKSQIRRKIIKPFNDPGLFKKFKRRSGGGVLMYGPPGCGKTMIAQALANECNANFIEARAADILDKWRGVSEKRIVDLFQKARTKRPAVLFFDEVEALAMRRNNDSSSGTNTIVSALLNEMNGFNDQNEGILFLGATNVPWSLDSAFRRPGRFDRTIFVPPPDRVARSFILNLLLKDRPVSDDLDKKSITEKTSGFSGADLEALVEAAVDYAIDDSEGQDDLTPLSNMHFQEALLEVQSSTGEWLGLAKSYSEYSTRDGLYDDLRAFLKKYG